MTDRGRTEDASSHAGRGTRFWRTLVEPSPVVQGFQARRRARFVSFLALVLAVSLFAGVIARYLNSGDYALGMLMAIPALAVGYCISRTRYLWIAAVIVVAATAIPCFLEAFNLAAASPERVWHAILWLALPILLTSFILDVRGTLITTASIVGFSFMLVLIMPSHIVQELIVASSILSAVAGLSIGAAAVHDRDRRAIETELIERRRVEEELRLAKEGLEVRVNERTKELREANERLGTLIRSSPAAVVFLDCDGKVALWNPAANRIFGWSEEEVSGEDSPLYDEDGGAAIDFTSGSCTDPPVDREVVIKRKDGGLVDVNLSSALISSDDGESVGYIAVLVDVSERKRLEERLRQSEKMEAIGQLAGGVAHDFNNLLTVIQGYTEIALRGSRPLEKLREDLRVVYETSERAASLVRQLLAFGRRQVLRPVPLDLNMVLSNMRDLLRRLLSEDVTLDFRTSEELWMVRADPGQIEQVIMNIAVNAGDAMPQGGTLEIETRNAVGEQTMPEGEISDQGDRWVVLSIHDTGHGMTADVKERIFEPFYTTKEFGRGTGLGLATVFGIVAQSGGTIDVESEPGEGSTFKVYLPAVVEELSGDDVPESKLPRGSETVLVVEDEQQVRELAARMLKGLGYKVLTASNGVEAVEVFSSSAEPVDLVLADVVMPEMGGPDCAERLRALRPELPVLFMSGHAEPALERHGALTSEVALLQKPFSTEELASSVRRALDSERSA